jgi:hypothetical protein
MARSKFKSPIILLVIYEENRVAVKDLGTKLTCQSCEAKFYDLKKKTPVCPKCDTEYVPVKPRARRASAKAVEAAKEVPAVVPAVETPANDDAPKTDDDVLAEIEVEVEDDDSEEEDNSLMEDTSSIGGDEDDMAGVIENIDTSANAKDS